MDVPLPGGFDLYIEALIRGFNMRLRARERSGNLGRKAQRIKRPDSPKLGLFQTDAIAGSFQHRSKHFLYGRLKFELNGIKTGSEELGALVAKEYFRAISFASSLLNPWLFQVD
jgi:hypothetical protein